MDTINRIVIDNVETEPAYRKKRGIVLLRRVDNLIFVSGHGPEDQITGVPLFQGRVGAELTPEQGYLAARECAVIILGEALGAVHKTRRLYKAVDFIQIAQRVLEERGYHVRTTMGTHNLPNGNIPVEIEVIVSVKD